MQKIAYIGRFRNQAMKASIPFDFKRLLIMK